MKINFNGQVVLVTGATRGIGKQIADSFSACGADLILTGTNEKQIDALNKDSINTGGGKKEYYAVDFTNTDSILEFLSIIKTRKKIDVCVNNAGINRINLIDQTRIQDWDDMISVNLKAPFLILRELSKLMKRNKYGRIVNISSIFGVISKEKRSIYSATKFGIHGLTVSLSNELARHNIFVNTVSPGFVLTELTKKNLSEEEMKSLADQVPAGRFATPDEIARVVLFLTSGENTYLTGQNIIVDGGFVNV